jgi:hypothetical protein
MLRRDLPGFDNLPEDPKDGVKYLRKKDPKWYNLWAGSTAIVDPVSKAKGIEKVRGRRCLVLWLDAFGHAGIKYLDSGRYGERQIHDLIPLLSEPIDIEVYRAAKARNKD